MMLSHRSSLPLSQSPLPSASLPNLFLLSLWLLGTWTFLCLSASCLWIGTLSKSLPLFELHFAVSAFPGEFLQSPLASKCWVSAPCPRHRMWRSAGLRAGVPSPHLCSSLGTWEGWTRLLVFPPEQRGSSCLQRDLLTSPDTLIRGPPFINFLNWASKKCFVFFLKKKKLWLKRKSLKKSSKKKNPRNSGQSDLICLPKLSHTGIPLSPTPSSPTLLGGRQQVSNTL